jgi:hypothetical protein
MLMSNQQLGSLTTKKKILLQSITCQFNHTPTTNHIILHSAMHLIQMLNNSTQDEKLQQDTYKHETIQMLAWC